MEKEEIKKLVEKIYESGWWDCQNWTAKNNKEIERYVNEIDTLIKQSNSNSAPSEYDPLEDSDDPRTMNLNNG